MSYASKFIVLAGGLIGLLGFFMPLVVGARDTDEVTISGFDVAKGLDNISEKLDNIGARGQEAAARVEDGIKSTLTDVRLGLLVIYIPAALLVIFGLLAVAKGRFGRVLATLSLLLGLGMVGLYFVAQGALADLSIASTAAKIRGGFGLSAILFAGGLGAIGGLLGLVVPERKTNAQHHQTRRHRATMKA